MLTLSILLISLAAGCQSGPTLREVLPGSKPFKIDRWDVAILVTPLTGTTDRVQVDIAVQEIDALGLPVGPGIQSGQELITVGGRFVWERAATTSERSLQIVTPDCRRSGKDIVVEMKIFASEDGKVVSTRPLEFKVR